MNNSPIEKEFIEWCKSLHEDFNAYIFLQRHSRYSEEYFPLFEELLTGLHKKIAETKPNINFSFKGRVKSKRSFLIKTFRTISENIQEIFPNELPEDSEELENFLNKRDVAIDKFFKFLINNNSEKYEKIKSLIKSIGHNLDTVEAFKVVFSQLNDDEKNKLVARLGRTEDAFAFRAIVHSVNFDISSISQSNNGFEIIDSEKKSIPIRTAIKFNPDKDIVKETNGATYIIVDGKKERLDERNLLYPFGIPITDRNIENAQKDANGNLTLLYDSLIINNMEYFDIVSISVDPNSKDILFYNQYGESKNLTLLLNTNKIDKLTLQKTDEEYTKLALYDILNVIKNYYEENGLFTINSRSKDYVKNPKADTNYMSLHNSAFNELFGYTIEAQIRDLKMEDDCKNEDSLTGHDQYKQNKSQKLLQNAILSHILKKNSLAFDSSTSTLLKILDNPDVELSEILAKYILITKIDDGKSISYQPPIDKIFEHTFEFSKFTIPKDSAPPLDISNYKKFITSRKIRNEFKRNENKFPDIYDD